ncbi:MAG: hypothetical protein ACOX7H_04805 [Bacillota bacterium]|jgi:hypothetical protein
MIFFAMTKPKKKLMFLLKVALVILLLALILPSLYNTMVEVNALERFTQGQSEDQYQYPGEPMRVDSGMSIIQTEYVEEIAQILYTK